MPVDQLFPFGPSLGYATNGLDRLSARREDDVFMAGLQEAPDGHTLVLVGDHVLLGPEGLPWFATAETAHWPAARHTAFLGLREGRHLFAAAIDPDGDAEAFAAAEGRSVKDLRAIAVEGALPPEDIGALAQAKALLHWHRHHGFCANCGAPTVSQHGGWRRACEQCGTLHFPRTDPVVIMMAVDGERCLLGRQPRFPPGMVSCLAGFLEPGETIEDAVRRELGEESGITVGTVRYLGSQPWPFPMSIMIGCLAEATSTELTIDRTELEDARWFSREDTRAILEGRHPDGFVCPPTMAIANHLMRAWAYGET